MFVSLIIPTYNESENLPSLLAEFFQYWPKNIQIEVIVVDDNSPDGTGEVAEKLMGKFPIMVIHRAGKLGLGSAVRAGFAKAKGDILGVMDADLSHDPAIIPRILEKLLNNDIVIGSRFVTGSVVENWPIHRKSLSKIGVWFARRLSGVTDPLSGYFFFRRSVIDGVELTTAGYKILFEILLKGKYNNVAELPFRFRMRQSSTSKLNAGEYWLFLKQLIGYSWLRIKK